MIWIRSDNRTTILFQRSSPFLVHSPNLPTCLDPTRIAILNMEKRAFPCQPLQLHQPTTLATSEAAMISILPFMINLICRLSFLLSCDPFQILLPSQQRWSNKNNSTATTTYFHLAPISPTPTVTTTMVTFFLLSHPTLLKMNVFPLVATHML